MQATVGDSSCLGLVVAGVEQSVLFQAMAVEAQQRSLGLHLPCKRTLEEAFGENSLQCGEEGYVCTTTHS